MLKIENITKIYKMGNQEVKALKKISLEFRKNEFVSILGQSGCGNTTLLNIIGGLDKYTSGDLIIDGKSTKQYKDKDWDTYRNHRIGFVFQSYNLIPHQTVLENVELALTLSGVSKEERRKRAIKVLTQVGLKDKIKNKPNQLSGGQMQRVAIARALVNDPDIILADEPTGALDSKTSVQIMELLKEISKEKLIIMVTHNPNLAKKYSTRIVKLLDGKLVSDSNPYSSTEGKGEYTKTIVDSTKESKRKTKKKSMSFFTALALSFKNLLTKKGRTFLVSFAGSIGIIGIALILAISSGFSSYVNKMQEDTLSSYPITIQAKSLDFSTVFSSLFTKTQEDNSVTHDNDAIYPKDRLTDLLNTIGNTSIPNDLSDFYTYLNEHKDLIKNNVSAIKYTYDLGLEFYQNSTSYNEDYNIQPNSNAFYKIIIMYSISFFTNNAGVTVTQNLDGSYKFGYIEGKTNKKMVDAYLGAGSYDIMEENGYLDNITEDFIINVINGMLGGTINLKNYSQSNMSAFYEMVGSDEIINTQYTLVYGSRAQNKNDAYLVLDKNGEVNDYVLYALGLISDEQLKQKLDAAVKGEVSTEIKVEYSSVINKKYKILTNMDYYVKSSTGKYIDLREYNNERNPIFYNTEKYEEELNNMFETHNDNTINICGIIRLNQNATTDWLSAGVCYSKQLTQNLMTYYNNKIDDYNADGGKLAGTFTKQYENLPTKIEIYVNTFESKDKIKSFVEDYNKTVEDNKKISYSDMVGTIMSTVSTIITAITYVLIAFVSVSLIVSSIMIGIITYISVIERTKEIGVLRSVGASKRDVKRVFTAESFIIGFTSGTLGVVICLLLLLPINLVLKSFTNIANLASLPWIGAIALIAISVVLTFIAGLIPARAAAKKDPVIALRTE